MSEWQPIETAPKDRRVLLYVPDELGGWQFQTGDYEDDWRNSPPRPFWRYDGDTAPLGGYSRAHTPTHWLGGIPAAPLLLTDTEKDNK